MFSYDFDFSDIAYANTKSKITLKTKQKLDELAKEVALWNQDSFFKKRDKSVNKIPAYSRRSRVIIDENNQPFCKMTQTDFYISPFDAEDVPKENKIPYLGSVKKKAAYFESLVAPQEGVAIKINELPNITIAKKNPLITYHQNRYNNEAKENMDLTTYAKENTSMSSKENNLPLTHLSDCTNQYESDNSSVTSEDSTISVLEEYATRILKEELCVTFPEEITFHRSMSFSEDIQEYMRQNYNFETMCVDADDHDTKPKDSPRHSKSWSEGLHQSTYVDDEEFDSTDAVNGDEKVGEYSQHDEDSNEEFLQNNDEFGNEEKIAAKDVLNCMEKIYKSLYNPWNYPAGKEHTAACVKLVKSSLVQKSVAERTQCYHEAPSTIESHMEMYNIRLGLKENFVIIDCNSLEREGRTSDLRNLKKLYHMVLMVRAHADRDVKSSIVYNVVSKTEAYRLRLPHQSGKLLEMFEYVKFNNLQPEFKLIFDLYCMEVSPKMFLQSGPKIKEAAFKKLFRCDSAEKVNSSYGGHIFFANIGSFFVTAKGVRPKPQRHSAVIGVHSECPFDGNVTFNTKFFMNLTQECKGPLTVYSEVAGIGCWNFYNCELTTSSIVGWLEHSSEPMDLVLPLYACLEPAQLCQYSICAKQNSFSIILDPSIQVPKLPFNKRKSTDGNHKERFLAATDFPEESSKWCDNINLAIKALARWTNEMSTDN